MFIFLSTCLGAMLLHSYIECAISVETNRSAECLLFQVPLKGLFYCIGQYIISGLDGCCTSTDFVWKWLVWKHGAGVNERKTNSIIKLENASENGNLIHLRREHAVFGIAINLLFSIKYSIPSRGREKVWCKFATKCFTRKLESLFGWVRFITTP